MVLTPSIHHDVILELIEENSVIDGFYTNSIRQGKIQNRKTKVNFYFFSAKFNSKQNLKSRGLSFAWKNFLFTLELRLRKFPKRIKTV